MVSLSKACWISREYILISGGWHQPIPKILQPSITIDSRMVTPGEKKILNIQPCMFSGARKILKALSLCIAPVAS